MVYDQAITIADIRDGASNTIIVAEDTGRGWVMNGEWADGQNIFDQTGPDQRYAEQRNVERPSGRRLRGVLRRLGPLLERIA